jgi:hypothetical protein
VFVPQTGVFLNSPTDKGLVAGLFLLDEILPKKEPKKGALEKGRQTRELIPGMPGASMRVHEETTSEPQKARQSSRGGGAIPNAKKKREKKTDVAYRKRGSCCRFGSVAMCAEAWRVLALLAMVAANDGNLYVVRYDTYSIIDNPDGHW